MEANGASAVLLILLWYVISALNNNVLKDLVKIFQAR
jgi:hypothetical protein